MLIQKHPTMGYRYPALFWLVVPRPAAGKNSRSILTTLYLCREDHRVLHTRDSFGICDCCCLHRLPPWGFEMHTPPPQKCGRYGLAADALIALGGLSAAVRDEDGGEARRKLVLTKESLNDILTIAVNNNLNRTD